MAAQRGIAILQRGRSHGGQVIVITQSAADIEALTGQPGATREPDRQSRGVVAHRQTTPESRDWLAKLMGTRVTWQLTSQTAAHGHSHTGQGSARRVREFRISSDTFGALGAGGAVACTPVAGEPARAPIQAVMLDRPPMRPQRVTAPKGVYVIPVHPALSLVPPRTDQPGSMTERTGPASSLCSSQSYDSMRSA
jgi:hypothetical protein